MNNAIYNFTGAQGRELVNIMAAKENGRRLKISSYELQGLKPGDTLLLDRPHFKNVPFKVELVNHLPQEPCCVIAIVHAVKDQLGGSRWPLKLKFKHSVYRK